MRETDSHYVLPSFQERHYTVAELSELWNLSTDAIRRLFQDEPGVLLIRNQRFRKRRYITILIPESVAARVHRRLILLPEQTT